MKTLTVEEAVAWVNSGNTLENIVLEEKSTQQVNVRDAMVLAEAGMLIPEEHIYYNDEDIEYDEDIDELVVTGGVVKLSWEEKIRKAQAYSEAQNQQALPALHLSTQRPEVDAWLIENQEKIAQILQPILISLFEAEKAMREGVE